jgi:hypothetical protein
VPAERITTTTLRFVWKEERDEMNVRERDGELLKIMLK